jgi:diketogulonate reductase-like aldo/keto reductase
MGDSIKTAGTLRGPGIIYGTAWKKSDTERLVATAIEKGFRGVDTACQPKHYDEAGVGAGVIAGLGAGLARADLFLQTKFTPASGQGPQIPYDPKAPLSEQVEQSFSVSLRNLRTDYVDSLLLHSPLADAKQTMEVWQAMERLVDSGVVVQIGISNCYRLEQLVGLFKAARVKPAVVQNRFYAESGYDQSIRAFCRTQRIAYQSFWTLTANPHVLAHDTVTALASQYARSPAQVLFRYLTQIGVVPLTGTRSEVHMQEDLAIFDFELTGAERVAVDTLFSRAH